MNRIDQFLTRGAYTVVASPKRGGYRHTVIPVFTEEIPRRLTDPLVLHECQHVHRRKSTAEACGERWVSSRQAAFTRT